jgi:hypothetical protein
MKLVHHALALAVVAGCGSSGASDAGGSVDAGGSSCQVTLSGAVTGTFSCLITLVYTSPNDRTTLGFEVAMPAPEQMINGVVTRSGMPGASQTWTQTDGSPGPGTSTTGTVTMTASF